MKSNSLSFLLDQLIVLIDVFVLSQLFDNFLGCWSTTLEAKSTVKKVIHCSTAESVRDSPQPRTSASLFHLDRDSFSESLLHCGNCPFLIVFIRLSAFWNIL